MRLNCGSTKKVVSALLGMLVLIASGSNVFAENAADPPMIGMYVHQHWPFNYPYAARTWTFEDWKGYADGLHRLGYNTIMTWPMVDTMPSPLTPSDKASLEKIARVIDMLHHDYKMKVWVVLSANVIAKDEVASKITFEKRHYYYSERFVNPADPATVTDLMKRREVALQYLVQADAFAIIDSDPGGYPKSTNPEFVGLLKKHRELFDRLRTGIKLVYWMHVGWPAYGRWYDTGVFDWSTHDEYIQAVKLIEEANLEPWGLAGARREILSDPEWRRRSIAFNYGVIEGEPSFPLTNFGGDAAYGGGKEPLARGLMGNAQTHCVQLPNTFAFARGATGKSLTDQDYVDFANQLITGQGRTIVAGWKALAGEEAGQMRKLAGQLEAISNKKLSTGTLRGLLLGSPKRFLDDLALQLKMKAAYQDFLNAVASKQRGRESLAKFEAAAEVWQHKQGYENHWAFPAMNEALRSLNSVPINHVLDLQKDWAAGSAPYAEIQGATQFEKIQNGFANVETYTPQMLEAMKKAVAEMKSGANSEHKDEW
jgi:hypothetical protein